jgi:hypothetical protein
MDSDRSRVAVEAVKLTGILAHLSRAFSDASIDLRAVCDIHWHLISLRNRIPSGETARGAVSRRRPTTSRS